MPHSVRSLIHKCFYQGKITQAEHDKIIRKLDSLERKGYWIDRSEGGRIKYPWWESHECSQCRRTGSGAWEYCPRCGAKME